MSPLSVPEPHMIAPGLFTAIRNGTFAVAPSSILMGNFSAASHCPLLYRPTPTPGTIAYRSPLAVRCADAVEKDVNAEPPSTWSPGTTKGCTSPSRHSEIDE